MVLVIWANFLHFYQPPTQKKYWVDRISNESYSRILKELQNHPGARLTINISAILLELWDKFDHQDLIEGYRKLVEKGQIEVTGSAKFHPLLPKLPPEEIIRQIKLNELTLYRYLGVVGPNDVQRSTSNVGRLRGFFPPEMAFDSSLAKIVESLGYDWVVCEELSYSDQLGKVDYSKIYQLKGGHLKLFFRDRYFSYKILSGQLGTANLFLTELGDRLNQKVYLFTAMDGETFGHHRPGLEKLLFELYNISQVPTVTVSEAWAQFNVNDFEEVDVKPSTWALMENDVSKRLAYARWDDPDNEIHQWQWEFTDLAIRAVQKSEIRVPNSDFDDSKLSAEQKRWSKARLLLDEALHSDQYWWASARPWWSLEMIERGARGLLDVIEALPDNKEYLSHAQDLYYSIITTGFKWQREGIVEAKARGEDEEIRMRTDEGLPKIPKEELSKMIKTVEDEMWAVTKNKEFERAAQLRDRIKELEAYLV